MLGINDDPVTIKNVEFKIVSHAWEQGFIKPVIAAKRTGKSVAIVGSGPSGLAAAQQLARAGHAVTVFEKNDRIGGLLRYGIPEFKMEKWIIDRRLDQMREEGVAFQTGVHVGQDLTAADLRKSFDAVLLCLGAEQPRDLPVEGRNLAGIHFAMEFLPQATKRVHGDVLPPRERHPGDGQARDRAGRRRHGLRLCGDEPPAGREIGHVDRAPRGAAHGQEPGDAVADVADDRAELELPRRGR